MLPKFAFHFITPTGTKGDDFEAEVTTISNRRLYCEIKTKAKQTPPTQQTLWRSLDKARQQLPRNQPGLVMIRIPEAWATAEDIVDIVRQAIEKVFRQSERLVAIVIIWEETFRLPMGPNIVATKYNYFVNRESPLYGRDVDYLLGEMGKSKNRSWLRFDSFVSEMLSLYWPTH